MYDIASKKRAIYIYKYTIYVHIQIYLDDQQYVKNDNMVHVYTLYTNVYN